MKNTIKLCNKDICCGCKACKEICITKSIVINTDKFGFSYPSINEITCIHCGMCMQVCPVKKHENLSNEIKNVYIGVHKDDSVI